MNSLPMPEVKEISRFDLFMFYLLNNPKMLLQLIK